MVSLDSSDRRSVNSNEVVSYGMQEAQLLGANQGSADKSPHNQSFARRVSNATSLLIHRKHTRDNSLTETQSNNAATDAVLGLENFGYTDDNFFGAPLHDLSDSSDSEDEESRLVKTLNIDYSDVHQTQSHETNPLEKKATGMDNITKYIPFFSNEFRESRKMIFRTLLTNYVFLIIGFAGCLCIYWGSFYGRDGHLKRLHYLVVNGDAPQGLLPAMLGSVVELFFSDPKVNAFGTFEIWDYNKSKTMALQANMTLEQLVSHQVHIQKYKAGYLVRENASLVMAQMLASANSSFSPSRDLLSVFYETGSDYNLINNYVVAITQQITIQFGNIMRDAPWNQFWFNFLNQTQIENVVTLAPTLFTTLPNFQMIDNLPVPRAIYQAPLQIGLIYLSVFTFFQFVYTLPVQIDFLKRVQGWRFLLVCFTVAQGAYLLLGLAFVLLNTAFQMNFRATFGNSGFLVIWMFASLSMSAIGSLMEALVLVCFIFKPACVGVIILFVAVTNLAPTISPIPLCPTFYRYGYAMPVYNTYHLMNVAYFNSWKGNVGRNIGILLAWFVLSNAMMPFALNYAFSQIQRRKAATSALAASSG